jgi:hypothetical protein
MNIVKSVYLHTIQQIHPQQQLVRLELIQHMDKLHALSKAFLFSCLIFEDVNLDINAQRNGIQIL